MKASAAVRSGSSAGAVAVVVVFAAALCGCAIQELKKDVATTQMHVDDKQQQLDSLERTQAELAAQRDQLLTDLRARELTAGQLQQRLERMRSINDASPARTDEQRQQRDRRARQLAEATRQAQAIERIERDAALSRQEKTRRLQQLKEDTRKMLELLLRG